MEEWMVALRCLLKPGAQSIIPPCLSSLQPLKYATGWRCLFLANNSFLHAILKRILKIFPLFLKFYLFQMRWIQMKQWIGQANPNWISTQECSGASVSCWILLRISPSCLYWVNLDLHQFVVQQDPLCTKGKDANWWDQGIWTGNQDCSV